MYCPRCSKNGKKIKMKPSKRSFHKKTKFLCSHCGLINMKNHYLSPQVTFLSSILNNSNNVLLNERLKQKKAALKFIA